MSLNNYIYKKTFNCGKMLWIARKIIIDSANPNSEMQEMEKYMKKFEQDRDFTRRLIRPNTWYIHGRPDSAVTYLVIGSERALVVEPGQNRNSIREYIETITDLPLVVCNTHGHFDHTASNGQFKDCDIFMSEIAAGRCKTPFPRVNPADYDFDYEPLPVKEGFVIDLGDRQVEAIAIPCHSPGSFAWLDNKYNLLFTGDEIESGQVLFQGDRRGDACVEKYYENLKKLKARESEIDLICPAHNGSPIDITFIDAFMENCEMIMNGSATPKKDFSSPTYLGPEDPREPETKAQLLSDPNIYRNEWKGTSIVYSINRILYEDIKK